MPRPRLAESTATVSETFSQGSPLRLLPAGSVVAGRYEVRGLLGTGGYAVVYSVCDRELKREIAMKVLRSDRVTATALKRMRREVAVAREAPGRRLVRVYDIGRSGDATYLTMELVRGESLRQRLRRGRLGVEEAVGIALQVAEALIELHRLKVVHRDVKPGNILLDQEGRVKLADFGLALELEGGETRATATDSVVGTVEYLSPEQALGREPVPPSDLYSLGVVLFEMLAGEVPHKADSALGTLLGHLEAPPPEVRRLRPEVPKWLSRVLRRLLAKELSQRYRSAEEVRRDLEQHRAAGFWLRRIARSAPAVSLVALMLAAALWLWTENRPRFSHLGALEGGGVAAIGTRGETLWKLPGVVWGQSLAAATLEPGGPLRVVGVLYEPDEITPDRTRVLSVLDPESGEVLRRVELPSAAEEFPGYSDRYGCVVAATDLDGDGGDEVVISYLHRPFWPSYTVLWEPRLDRSRVVFVGSGHHRFVGGEDLDGDGHRELLLVGINNRMGWYSAVAAVRLDPPAGEVRPTWSRVARARSPDAWALDQIGDGLLWYALVPQGGCGDLDRCLEIDRHSREIEVILADRTVRLDYSGFAPGPPQPASSSPEARAALRREAYERLREARRLLDLGFPSDAIVEADRALDAAAAAGDAVLSEWVSRVRARLFIAHGDVEEAERALSVLMATSEAASEVAYDAARAYHLQGALGRAVAWYRRGLGPGGSSNIGKRGRMDFLEGIVLGLAEAGEWDEALSEIEAFATAFPQEGSVGSYRAFATWRSGRRPDPSHAQVMTGSPDLLRYWALEIRAASGEDPGALLPIVGAELERTSGTEGLLWSLQSELLAVQGRMEEALDRAREAYSRLREDRATDTTARAHFELVADRFVRLADRLGTPEDAREASLELLSWRESTERLADVPPSDLAVSAPEQEGRDPGGR